MIDHIGLSVANLGRSKAFYRAALAPLGYKLVIDEGGWVAFGAREAPGLWLRENGATAPRVHVAFRAGNMDVVNAFHDAAVSAGGTDNGPPGLRPHFHPDYYGAFVFDPDGHNIEAMCRTSETPE